MPALLGTTHPLGVLRRDLLEVFEERLSAEPAERTADVHALLNVLQSCTREACGVRATDRRAWIEVCECIECAAFEGDAALLPTSTPNQDPQSPAIRALRCCLGLAPPPRSSASHAHPWLRCYPRAMQDGLDGPTFAGRNGVTAASSRAVAESKLFFHAFAGASRWRIPNS